MNRIYAIAGLGACAIAIVIGVLLGASWPSQEDKCRDATKATIEALLAAPYAEGRTIDMGLLNARSEACRPLGAQQSQAISDQVAAEYADQLARWSTTP